MEIIDDRSTYLYMRVSPYFVKKDFGKMQLVPEAPPEIVKLRDEFLKLREEHQKKPMEPWDY